jgi:hypothetical protein
VTGFVRALVRDALLIAVVSALIAILSCTAPDHDQRDAHAIGSPPKVQRHSPADDVAPAVARWLGRDAPDPGVTGRLDGS